MHLSSNLFIWKKFSSAAFTVNELNRGAGKTMDVKRVSSYSGAIYNEINSLKKHHKIIQNSEKLRPVRTPLFTCIVQPITMGISINSIKK